MLPSLGISLIFNLVEVKKKKRPVTCSGHLRAPRGRSFCTGDFKTSLLRENLHTVQFTHLKRTTWWFLVYSQSYTSIITVSFRIFLSPQKNKQKPCPLTITFLSSHPPLPQVTSNLNSFCLIVLPILDTSYQWKQTTFCVWLLSAQCFQGSFML